jgi:hypothetical protein
MPDYCLYFACLYVWFFLWSVGFCLVLLCVFVCLFGFFFFFVCFMFLFFVFVLILFNYFFIFFGWGCFLKKKLKQNIPHCRYNHSFKSWNIICNCQLPINRLLNGSELFNQHLVAYLGLPFITSQWKLEKKIQWNWRFLDRQLLLLYRENVVSGWLMLTLEWNPW